jgi:hypothetical protein
MGGDRFLDLVEEAVDEPAETRRRELWTLALRAASDPLRRALALTQLATLDVETGELERGLQRFDEARELAPDAPFVYRGAAEALRAAGVEQTAEVWDRAAAEMLARDVREHGTALTIPWHPADLWDEVVEADLLPATLRAPTHQAYSHLVDRMARSLLADGMRVVAVRPAGTHDETVGEPVPWPPARNDACWCGSGEKYKRCCGRR